jgi:hypothetical protein
MMAQQVPAPYTQKLRFPEPERTTDQTTIREKETVGDHAVALPLLRLLLFCLMRKARQKQAAKIK